MTLALRYAARSDRGLIRGNNQDSVYAGPRLLAVADGMGGHVGGEVASKIVIAALAPLDDDTPGEDLIAQLRGATENANAHLRDVMAQDPTLDGMGTTLTAMLFAGNRLGLVHVGDSRAYLLRGGQLTQITHDDTFVQALVDEGRLTAEEASVHPQRSLILRALNGTDVDPDLSIREARVNDRYLLCSDGLSGVVSTETLYEALQIPDPRECADRLIELALRGGGPDNVTCIVADVLDVGYGDDAPVIDGAAGGNRGQRDVAPTSAAARAALADPRRRDQPADDAEVAPPRRRRRRPLRTALLTLAVLALLGGGGYGVWRWTQTQFFVGADGDHIAVYRGVNASLGPVHLFRVDHATDLRLHDLQQVARDQVRSGISAHSADDAERIVDNLRDDQMPLCPTPSPTPTVTPTPTVAPTRTPPRPAVPTRTPAGSPRPTTRPTPTATPTATHGHADRSRDADGDPGPRTRLPGGGLMSVLPGAATPPTRRGVELGMLLFAVGVVMAADAIVDVNARGGVGVDVLTYGAGFAMLWLAAHVVVRMLAPYADPLLLPAAALLTGLGLVLIRRVDIGMVAKQRQLGLDPPTAAAGAQILWMGVGLAFFVAVLLVIRDHRVLSRYAYTLGFSGLVFLTLPAVLPAQFSMVHGARIWIRVAGFSIQPGEFAKLALMVFFASYLVAKRDVLSLASRRFVGVDLPRGRDLGPVLVAWLASVLVLVRERDLGTSLLFFGIFVVMLYVATERTSWLLIGLLLFVVGAYLSYLIFGHVQERVEFWLDPFGHRADAFQIIQSLFGLATGGLFGTGLGAGRPETVPFANSDFIVATVGEELGLFGLVALLLVYALIVERGLRAALSVRDAFGKLLAAGLAFGLGWQVFVVVGGVTKLIPLTGLTTPFLSYGGSSLVVNLAIVALLMRISDAARRPATPPPQANQPLAEALTEVVKR